MNSILLLSLLSLLSYCSSLQCDYFDPNTQPNNCDVIISQLNHSDINQTELENLKSFISSSSINSFQLLYKNDIIISIGTAQLDSTISLNQPFLLSLSSILFSDSSHYSYPPFSSLISRLTPGVEIDIPLDSYLFDILSLQLFDYMNDRYWYGPNITIALSRKAVPIIESILESNFQDSLRHLVQRTRTVLGLEHFRLDQTSEGNKLIRSTTKDILRLGNIVRNLMEGDYSNYSMVYSHFPLRSEELIRGYKEFKYGWWVNGAQYQGDNSNLFKLAPGDMIGSMECEHSLYIAPSWEMVLLVQRSKKSCDNNTNWLVEDKNVWTQLSKVYSGKDGEITRYSLGFVTSGVMIVKNFMFYALYCIVGHVATTYVTKLIWNISTLISSKTEFKHT